MRKTLLTTTLIVLLSLLFASLPALAQEPIDIPVLEQGTPYEPAGTFATAAVSGECDYLPAWLDHRGEGDVLPDWFPEDGTVDEILEATGLKVDTTYGCQAAKPGQTYVAVTALELKCGDAAIQPRVEDVNGDSLESVLLWLNWPNMGDASTFPASGDPRYFNEAVGCFTDGGGSCGWGYGGGSFIVPGQGGPFSIWPNSCIGTHCIYGEWPHTDALLYTGWFGGTNHCDIQPWFSPRVKGGDVPPPGNDSLVVFVDGVQQYYIRLIPGEPGGAGFDGLKFVGEDGTTEWHVPGWRDE